MKKLLAIIMVAVLSSCTPDELPVKDENSERQIRISFQSNNIDDVTVYISKVKIPLKKEHNMYLTSGWLAAKKNEVIIFKAKKPLKYNIELHGKNERGETFLWIESEITGNHFQCTIR